MRDLAVSLIVLLSILIQNAQSEKKNELEVLTLLEDDPCQLETAELDWKTLKERILETGIFMTDDDKNTLPLSLSNNQLSTTLCQPRKATNNSANGNNCVCSPSIHEKKTMSFPVVSGDNEQLLVTLDYMEALGCTCLPPKFVGEMFPIITDVSIAKSCANSSEQAEPVVVEIGETASMEFPYFAHIKEDIPTKFTLFRSFDPSQFLGISILRSIKTTSLYNDPRDWRSRANVTTGQRFLTLDLMMVTRDDEGTYLCNQEFFGSSPCFSLLELKVAGETTGRLNRRCQPKATSIGWASVFKNAAELAGNTSFIASSSNIDSIKVHKCRSDPRTCIASNRQCVSSSTSKQQVKMCLWDADGKPKQYEIDYEEDETCSCAPKDPFPKRSLMTDAQGQMSIINVKRGNCSNSCTPEYINVPWTNIKSRINQWTFLSLTSKMEGPDLRMKRCHQSLNPCNIEGTYCDVRKDKITSKTLKLKNYDIKIRIKYYEAVSCECRQSTNMSYDFEEDTVHDSPVLTYVKAKKTKKRKRRDHKRKKSERRRKRKE